MRKNERLALSTDEKKAPGNPDEQINELIQRRKLQQHALKKIITSIDKADADEKNSDHDNTGIGQEPRSKGRK